MSIKSLGTAIEDLVQSLGIKRKMREYDAVLRWEEAVGSRISQVAMPVKIDRGVLVVRVQASAWRNELNLRKDEIIAKLNTMLGEKLVKEIRFV